MTYKVEHTPIRKDGKIYQVGETFPYSDEDKSLLTKGYLTVTKAKETDAKKADSQSAKAKVEKKKKANAAAKKNNSKNN